MAQCENVQILFTNVKMTPDLIRRLSVAYEVSFSYSHVAYECIVQNITKGIVHVVWSGLSFG